MWLPLASLGNPGNPRRGLKNHVPGRRRIPIFCSDLLPETKYGVLLEIPRLYCVTVMMLECRIGNTIERPMGILQCHKGTEGCKLTIFNDQFHYHTISHE